MAKVRRAGFGTVFQVEDSKVGIGTTVGSDTFRVFGDVTSSNANVINVATVPTYKGFLDNETRLSSNEVDLDNIVGYVNGEPYYGDFHVHNRSDGTQVNMVGSAHTTIKHAVIGDESDLQADFMGGDIVIDGEFTVSPGASYCSSVDQLTVTSGFAVPTGNTDDRIHCHTAGSMRFNEDLGTLEFYTGDEWKAVNSFKDTGNRGRAVFSSNVAFLGGGAHLDFVNMSSQGNTTSFGVLTVGTSAFGCSSETRGVWSGGYNNPSGVIDYITIASQGNAIAFGSLNVNRKAVAATSSSTRGMWAGGYVPTGGGAPNRTNTIQYVEIQTLGNALDFGDLTTTEVSMSAVSSPTRGIFSGGYTLPSQNDMVTIASKGNAIRFSDMRVPRARHASCSNSTRGVFGAGRQVNNSQLTSEIEYITIASEGTATYFGDITKKRNMVAAASSQTRGLFAGGYDHPLTYNIIDFITFSSTGIAQDFGDCIEEKRGVSGLSDSHGGLGGF